MRGRQRARLVRINSARKPHSRRGQGPTMKSRQGQGGREAAPLSSDEPRATSFLISQKVQIEIEPSDAQGAQGSSVSQTGFRSLFFGFFRAQTAV